MKHVRERQIELVLKKKEDKGPYWPHLTKEKNKYHWLKVDFNKWKDEDDSEDDMEGMEGGGFDDVSIFHILVFSNKETSLCQKMFPPTLFPMITTF